MKNNIKFLDDFREYLNELFPDAECALIFKTPFQLLVSTILSAQCTDKQVNKTTPLLFEKYPDPESMAKADVGDIAEIIKSIGFFNTKSRNIHNAAKEIMNRFKGVVPDNLNDLVTLPGVGRKTANVVLGNAFGVPGMVVDTHVKRIANRLGLTNNSDPEKIEQDLMKIIPKEEWTRFSHQLVLFGRAKCDARKPDCANCKASSYCKSAKQ